MRRKEKELVVEELRKELQLNPNIILTDYKGHNVKELTELRCKCREVKANFKVVKNTLLKLATKDTGFPSLSEYLTGPIGIALGKDSVVLAKTLVDFKNEYKKLKIKAGVLDGTLWSGEDVEEIANLPSREDLLAQLTHAMNGPIRNLIGVLSSPIQSLIYVLSQIKDRR
jgi:large subunit ribosomal protein L10